MTSGLPIAFALWMLLVGAAGVTLWLAVIGLALVLSRAAALGDRTDPEIEQDPPSDIAPFR
jgi:hypothetical protein